MPVLIHSVPVVQEIEREVTVAEKNPEWKY
jgi:hypothetical protein